MASSGEILMWNHRRGFFPKVTKDLALEGGSLGLVVLEGGTFRLVHFECRSFGRGIILEGDGLLADLVASFGTAHLSVLTLIVIQTVFALVVRADSKASCGLGALLDHNSSILLTRWCWGKWTGISILYGAKIWWGWPAWSFIDSAKIWWGWLARSIIIGNDDGLLADLVAAIGTAQLSSLTLLILQAVYVGVVGADPKRPLGFGTHARFLWL